MIKICAIDPVPPPFLKQVLVQGVTDLRILVISQGSTSGNNEVFAEYLTLVFSHGCFLGHRQENPQIHWVINLEQALGLFRIKLHSFCQALFSLLFL